MPLDRHFYFPGRNLLTEIPKHGNIEMTKEMEVFHMALRNEDLAQEVWDLMAAGHWTKTEVARRVGITDTHINRTVNRPHVDQKLIDIMDVLGYDVEVRFLRKRNR